MSLIDPTQRTDLGYWPERRQRDRHDRRPFTLASRPEPAPLPPAPLTALPSLLEPATPEPPTPGLRIAFYAEHQPLAAPAPSPGNAWDTRI